jgi:hypothetical protein
MKAPRAPKVQRGGGKTVNPQRPNDIVSNKLLFGKKAPKK